MGDQDSENILPEKYQFGSADPFLPGITLCIPNLYPATDGFNRFFFNYLASDDSYEQYAITKHFMDSSDDRWEKFFTLCLSTAAIHETRHFHEFYGSPFGAKVLAGLIINAIIFPVILQVLQEEDTIAVPIASWARLPDQLHALYQAGTRSGRLNRTPPAQAAKAALRAESAIEEIKQLYGTTKVSSLFGFCARHIMETAALSVQIRVILDLFGNETADGFCRTLNLYDQEKEYSRMEPSWQIVGKSGVPSIVRNAIAFFSLCGLWWDKSSSQYSNPADRFMEVCLTARLHSWTPSDDGVLPFLDRCSKEMNVPNLDESLHQSTLWFDNFIVGAKESVNDMWGRLNLKMSLEQFLKFLDELAGSHKYMTTMIRQNPISFFDPEQYIGNAKRWLAAPRWYRSETYFYSPSNPALNLPMESGKGDWHVPAFLTVEGDENVYAPLLLSKYPTNGKSIISIESSYNFGIANYIGNVMWTRGFSNPVDEKCAFWQLQQKLPEKELIFLRQ